jgi:hypothetical protein
MVVEVGTSMLDICQHVLQDAGLQDAVCNGKIL